MPHPSSARSVLPLLLTIFLDVVGLGIAIPILAVIFISKTESILPPDIDPRLRPLLYGLLIAAYPFAQFFGAPILGALSDQHGRKKLLLLSLAGTAAGYVLFAIGIVLRSIPLLFLSRILDGFTGGNISIAQSAMADTSDTSSKTRAFGLMGMTFGLGFILGPTLGGILSDSTIVSWFSPSVPFWFAALLTILNMALLSTFFKETLHTQIHTPVTILTGIRNIRKAFTTRGIRTVFFILFLFFLGVNIFQQFFQIYLIEAFSFTQGDIGMMFGFIGLCIALTQGLVVRPISRRFEPAQVLRFSLLGVGIALPFLLLPTQSIWLYAVIPFTALFQGLTFPNSTALVSNLIGKESQGEGLGLNQSVQAVAQMLPPILAGTVAYLHPGLPIVLASFFVLLSWIFFLTLYSPATVEIFHEV